MKLKHNNKVLEQREKERDLCLLIALCAIVVTVGGFFQSKWGVTNFCPENDCNKVFPKMVYAEETLSDYQKIDRWVDIYSEKYGKTRYEINRLKALTHYLLLREQNYGGSTNCGDSGLACGPMQFHAGTYTKNRNDMIKKGLTKKIGSRENMENAIETAIYMFSIGQEKQWGPVLREEIKL